MLASNPVLISSASILTLSCFVAACAPIACAFVRRAVRAGACMWSAHRRCLLSLFLSLAHVQCARVSGAASALRALSSATAAPRSPTLFCQRQPARPQPQLLRRLRVTAQRLLPQFGAPQSHLERSLVVAAQMALPQPADICPAAQAARRARGRQRRAAIWRAAEGRGRGRCLD